MRYYSTKKRGQVTVADDFTIIDTDTRVKNFFEPTPEGYVKAYTDEGLPFNELIPAYVEPEKSPYELMANLEATRTPRREREARMGVTGSQQWLDDLDLEIEALRPEL